MKTSSKLLIAAGMMAGGAMALLFAPAKGSDTRVKLNKQLSKLTDSCKDPCSREKLNFVKTKLEGHKEKLEKHLLKINSKLAEFESGNSVETV
jgi:gas vesicle protein